MNSRFHITTETKDQVQISHKNFGIDAIIGLGQGGRLVKCVCTNNLVIGDPTYTNYSESYAGALLFPFVNRVEHGTYRVEEKEHHLECNDQGKHALHGLVYDKQFRLKQVIAEKDRAQVDLEYHFEGNDLGFPFTFDLGLTYCFTSVGLRLEVTVTNSGSVLFPFSLGWHPYFFTSDKNASKLSMPRDQNIITNQELIPVHMETADEHFSEIIGEVSYDHCFKIRPARVVFDTPEHKLTVTSSSPYSFVQLYAPEHQNYFAIEPMTSPGNSFNNKIGLLKLSPKETFHLNWNVQINQSFKT